jgi:hypothetical protein
LGIVLASRGISIRSEDVAGAHRRVVDHGEDDDLAFLLFNTNRYVGWDLVRGLGYWWACVDVVVMGCCGAEVQQVRLSLSFLFF